MKKKILNKTKKIIVLSLTLALSFSLYGCGDDEKKTTTQAEETTQTPDTNTDTGEVTIDEDLNTIFNDSIAAIGAGNYPDPYMIRPIDMSSTDDMLYVLGVEDVTGMEKGAVMEPMMSSIAFSLVVVKFDTADNAAAAAKTLYDAAPQQKWLCVLPEGVFTKVIDDSYLIVFMGPQSSIDALK